MKATIKKAITGILAAAMCAVPMASAMSASAAERIVNLDKSLQLELKKADLTKINSASLSYELKGKVSALDIDARIPIDPDNPTIPNLPEIKEIRFVKPDIRDIKPIRPLPNPLPLISTSQIIEEIFTLSYVDGNYTIKVVIGYTTDGKYIMEYWRNARKVNGTWRGILIKRTTATDPASNATLVNKVSSTNYYMDVNYNIIKHITGYTKGGNYIVENWRLSDLTGKWVLVNRKITKPRILRPIGELTLEKASLTDAVKIS